MTEEGRRCSHTFDPGRWERTHDRACQVGREDDAEILEEVDGRPVWRCPHEAISGDGGEATCVFHLPRADRPDGIDPVDEFVAIVDGERERVDGGGRRPAQFIDASFDHLDIAREWLGTGDPIDLRHARIGRLELAVGAVNSPLDASGAVIDGQCWAEGVSFRDEVRFQRTRFRGWTSFADPEWNYLESFRGTAFDGGATFDDRAQFTGATFADQAHFVGATFADRANFAETTFDGWADFTYTTFADRAQFAEATFDDRADFVDATFDGWVEFTETTFDDLAGFSWTTFADRADFSRTTFDQEVAFREATFDDEADFAEATFDGQAVFAEAAFGGQASFENAAFDRPADSENAPFGGLVNFENATFGDVVNFENVTFGGPLIFDEVTFEGRAAFTNAVLKTISFERTNFHDDAVFRTDRPEQ